MDKLTYIALGGFRFPGIFAIPSRNREEGQVAKAAGLWFHGDNCRPNCAACAAKLPKPTGWGKPAYWWIPADTTGIAKASTLAHHADESANTVLGGAVKREESSRAKDCSDIDVPVPAGLALYGYQKAGVAFAMGRKGTLLADSMGLGKSPTTLGVINCDPTCESVLVVCPASLRLNWMREACRWLVRKTHIHIVDSAKKLPKGFDPNGHTVTIGTEVPEGAKFVIANYDRVRNKATFASLMTREYDLLAFDEAHALKNPKSQRTVAVLGKPSRSADGGVPGLISRAKRVMALTGTPIPNRPIELHPLLAALAPETFGNFMWFAKRFCNAHQEHVPGAGLVWNFGGSSNLQELQTLLRQTVMVRRTKEEVLTELPAKVRQLVALPAEGASKAIDAEWKAYELHEDALEEARVDVELAAAAVDETNEASVRAYEDAVAALRKAQQVAFEEMAVARHEVAKAKLPAVIEHVRGMLEDGVSKVVVFAHHRGIAEAIREAFADVNPVMIIGGVSSLAKDEAVQRFQNDPTCRVFVGNIQAAGVGLTLTAAHHVVFAELDWVPGNVTQSEDRCHRIGQLDTVFVQHLVLDGSLDQKMATTLIAKQAIADKALDTRRMQLAIPADRPMPEPKLTPSAPKTKTVDPNAEIALPIGKHLRVERPVSYPEATPEMRTAAKQAMQQLAGMCDGALARDDMGFSKIDAHIGHKLARIARDFTNGETWLAGVLCRRYHRQIGAEMIAAATGATA